MNREKIFTALPLLLATILIQVSAVSFDSLYERELKTSYGFEILKYYHDEQFGNETIKKFKG